MNRDAARTLLISLILVAGCGSPTPATFVATETTTKIGGTMTPLSQIRDAEIHYVDIRRGKPPSATLYFDVTLRNSHSEERWFLLPRSLDSWRDIGRSGGVTRSDIYEYGSSTKGKIRLGDFSGNGGFTALLLPAGAEVILHRLGIPIVQDLTGVQKQAIILVTASDLKIEGQDARSWFGGTALSDKRADVAADQGNKVYSHNSSNSIELPVTLSDEQRITLEVPIT